MADLRFLSITFFLTIGTLLLGSIDASTFKGVFN